MIWKLLKPSALPKRKTKYENLGWIRIRVEIVLIVSGNMEVLQTNVCNISLHQTIRGQQQNDAKCVFPTQRRMLNMLPLLFLFLLFLVVVVVVLLLFGKLTMTK